MPAISRRRLPPPAAVLFDLDGTLVDTAPTRREAWMRAFAEFGIAADPGRVAGLIGSDGRRLARVVAEAARFPIDPEQASAVDRRAGEIYDALNADPRPLPGVGELLGLLRSRRVPWAIATSSLEGQVKRSVGALKLGRAPMIVDGSHVEHAKPAPDLLLRAAQELDVSPETVWYVGDATADMEAAGAAAMPAIGVTTGFAAAEDLEAAGAWLVIRRLIDLAPLLPRPR